MVLDDAVAPTSDGTVRWGILATGGIARIFTRDLLVHGHRVTAVGSRSYATARAFADEFGIERAHGSYDELVADPQVDVVYVATPHNLHLANATAALEQAKHVLVEKSFTVNAAEARQLAALARSKRLLVLEAMWTRFLPHMHFVRDVVGSGRIGEVRTLHADHAQQLPADPAHRLNDPDLAGGALLELGVYPLSFAHDLAGPPTEVLARGTLRTTGVDASVATVLTHANGVVSTSFSSSEVRGPNNATVVGTKGRIEIAPFWYTPTRVTVYDNHDEVTATFDEPFSGRGMQYQAAEVERLLATGETESPLLALDDSIAVLTTMDAARRALGVHYGADHLDPLP
ncbi:MAG: gfo/Idh/MocA family oxidoreductase [Streptosporangiales bacterium]|nr:gfo/Idh/MocA family oxidoreductase [Streptosporangiales bacterium]